MSSKSRKYTTPDSRLPTPGSEATKSDYDAKTSQEAAQRTRHGDIAAPEPFGDPLSGIVLVAERATASAQLIDALRRSLAAVRLDRAYVTWSSPDLLVEILSLEPGALVAVGPEAARAIDAAGYPLVKLPFSEAPEGSWFAWTKGTSGLRLPALAPALEDAGAKRRFWQAFQALRALGCVAVLLAMLTALLLGGRPLPALPFIAVSFVLANAKPFIQALLQKNASHP